MNLVLRDLYYNKLCASCLVPDRVRRLLYSWGGYRLELVPGFARIVFWEMEILK